MNPLFSGSLAIEYGQFYISIDGDEIEDLDAAESFNNQENGLCGAAKKELIFFVTGIQNGVISVDVDLYDTPPNIDDSFDEIVEVSVVRGEKPLLLSEWAWEESHELQLPKGNYRLRYCIAGMDKEYDDESEEDNHEYWESPLPGQRHLIQMWPSEKADDKVLKQTTENASYWHSEWGSWQDREAI